LVSYPNQKHLIPKDRLVLARILKALDLDLAEDVAIINIQKEQLNWDKLTHSLNFSSCLAFGVERSFFLASLQEHEVTTTEEGIQILTAPALEEVAANKPHKKRLWQNLKTIFQQV